MLVTIHVVEQIGSFKFQFLKYALLMALCNEQITAHKHSSWVNSESISHNHRFIPNFCDLIERNGSPVQHLHIHTIFHICIVMSLIRMLLTVDTPATNLTPSVLLNLTFGYD